MPSISSYSLLVTQKMATHFSILAWEIPWTEEPDRLPSVASQKESDTTYGLNNNNGNNTGLQNA